MSIRHTQDERDEFVNEVLKRRKFDILVGTYEGAKTLVGQLSRLKWETLVIDEAHKIKNFETQNFTVMFQYQAEFKLLLTGTPLSNNLQELWSLLVFIMPHLFKDSSLFTRIEESVNEFEGTEDEKFEFQKRVAKAFH